MLPSVMPQPSSLLHGQTESQFVSIPTPKAHAYPQENDSKLGIYQVMMGTLKVQLSWLRMRHC